MFTQKHTSEALSSALELIRDECRAHPEDCTECPLSFSDGGPIRQCGITDRFFTPSEWDISPVEHWQAFADETRRTEQ